jgi:hypothetical protein
MTRSLALALLVLSVLGGAALALPRAIARADATVDVATVENGYPTNLTFKITAHADTDITDASLSYSITGASSSALGKPTDFQPGKNISASVVVDTNSGTKYIPVGSEFTWHWDLTTADGKRTSTPDQKFVYLPSGQDWKTVQSDVMVIYYHGDQQALANTYLKAGLDTYDRMAKKLLASDLKVVPVRVVLFNDTKEAATARQGQGATYDAATITCGTKFAINVIHVTALANACGDDPADTLRHEFTHIINETAAEGVPGEKGLGRLVPWIDEGTAVNGQLTPGADYAGAFKSAVAGNRIIPFSAMLVTATDPTKVLLWYGQAYTMVKYLIDKGPDKYAQFFATIKKGGRWDDALKQVYGFDYAGFESEFRKANGLPASQSDASPTSRPQQQTTPTVRPTVAATSPSTVTAASSTTNSNNTDNKMMIVIVGIAVLFGLLAIFAYLVSVMMANGRKNNTGFPGSGPPGGDPPAGP